MIPLKMLQVQGARFLWNETYVAWARKSKQRRAMSTKGITVFLLFVVMLSSATLFASDSRVIAEMRGWNLTNLDLERIIGYYPPDRQKRLMSSPETRAKLVNTIVQSHALANLAKEEGFDQRPDILEQIQIQEDEFLAKAYVLDKLTGPIEIKEENLRLYYKTHKEEFIVPARVKIRQIFLKASKDMEKEKRDQLREKGQTVLAKLKAGQSFKTLASEFSDDRVSSPKGGERGWLTKDYFPKTVWLEINRLKKGEISKLIEIPYGFYIIQLEDRHPSELKTFDKVKDNIRAQLIKKINADEAKVFLYKALEKMDTKIYYERLVE
jgi:peptidylprolyl isomerase